MSVDGQVALVTGAARGIGAAIAGRLAAAGASVAVCDVDGNGADETAGAITRNHDARALAVELDVADGASVDGAVATIDREWGGVDILVNNAGVDVIGPFLESDEDAWDRIIDVNLAGTIRCCHRVLPGMVERRFGKVVNIGSDAGKVGSSGEAVYSASKGGVIAFTKALAREVAREGITVNAVCPGPTDTALLDQLADTSQKLYDSLAKAIPLRRIGQPSDVAGLVAFLVSEEAAYITGQAVSVSGGLTMG